MRGVPIKHYYYLLFMMESDGVMLMMAMGDDCDDDNLKHLPCRHSSVNYWFLSSSSVHLAPAMWTVGELLWQMLEVDSKNDTIVTMSIEKVPFTKRCMNLYVNIKWGIHTHRSFHSTSSCSLHKHVFTHRMPVQTDAFTNSCFCTQVPLRTHAFT